jgi:ABC-2 type transport system ATP-binding protein/lipopolysaccharide transport system ATP-binding protein
VTVLDSDAEYDAAAPRARPVRVDRGAAIVVDDVSKRFRLYRERASSLKETITSRRGRRARFEEFWALRNVSVTVPKGSTFGFIGHNGSGKSTLLRLMAGIHPPTSGTVRTEGRISALLELGAGFHPELSGRENVYLNGSILGLTRREVNSVLGEIIEFSGLQDFIDSPVKHYSSGMYVRLGFAVAVHVKPEILMIDEVIAVGDEEFQRRCFDYLYKLRRDGVTIVMVSHSAPLMEQMCDQVAWLDHGVLLDDGDPSDVVRKYLEKVNVAESERLATTGEVQPVDPDDDPKTAAEDAGTREIEILGFELLDGAGRVIPAASTGDPLTVRVRYHAHAPIAQPVFGIGFETEHSVRVSGPNTRFSGVDTGVVEGEGHVDYTMDRLPLMPGGWRLAVTIVDERMLHVYDRVDPGFEFHVQPGSSVERYGIVDPQGRWGLSD